MLRHKRIFDWVLPGLAKPGGNPYSFRHQETRSRISFPAICCGRYRHGASGWIDRRNI